MAMAFKSLVGAQVRIKSHVKGDPLLDGFEDRYGRVSHLVAGEDNSKEDPIWVVAVARSNYERKLLFSNASNSIDEATCSWIPVPQRFLDIINSSTSSDSTPVVKKPRVGVDVATNLSHIPQIVSQTQEDEVLRNSEREESRSNSHPKLPSVCVIVCFRDLHVEQKRGEHLAKFVPHMITFFSKAVSQGICERYRILIVEQSDDNLKFNRGKLLNIGFDLSKDDGFDAFVFHDVDLLPDDNLLPYYCKFPQPGKPIHIARVWERYNANPSYMGGVVSWNKADFMKINGFPNNYWGWGGEDDEMMRRCRSGFGAHFAMESPKSGSLIDLEEMDLTTKLSFLRGHRDWKNYKKLELEHEHKHTWQANGINSLSYRVLSYSTQIPQSTLASNMSKNDEVNTVFRNHRFVKVTVECCLNGKGEHDEWAGIDFNPA